jgi:uncharacterized membrane protein YhiD involved in acid resistance
MVQFITYLGLSTLSSALVLFVLWLCRAWLLARLTKSIEHEYAVKLEEYKYEIEKRKKAEMVAKLLAHWLAIKPEDSKEELNRLAFECYLWLPDDIAKNLCDLLAHNTREDVTVKSVIIEIRQHLNKKDNEYKSLTASDLTHFSKI